MGRSVAVLAACVAAVVGLVGAHAIEAGAVRGRMANALPASRQFALTAVSFGNAQDGWAAAQLNQQGYILHTHDGGRSWTRYPVGFVATQMQFINGTDGWAVGTVPLGCVRSCRNVVEFTGDGGRTWVQQREAGPCWLISSLQFANGADGWVVEAKTMCGAQRTVARVIRTTDGGRTWHIAFSMQAEVIRLHFGDALHGWLAAGGASTAQCNTVVFHSADGGLTWTRQFRVNGYCMAQVDFVNGRQGWLLATNMGACSMGGCYDNRLYHSVDGGRHWALEQSATLPSRHLWSGPSGFLGALVFVTPWVGYIPVSAGAGPGQGGLDVTRDGGRHWVRLQPHRLEASNMSPVSAPEAWAVGCVQHADNCNVLLHTRDTGRTWQVVHPARGTPAASAVQTMVQVVAGVAPCRAAQLRAMAAWQGATGSLAGSITIVNRGPAACAVSGRPGVVIRGSNGDIARTVERPTRAFEGAPVGTTVLVPGQRAFVFVLWMNFCGRIRPPLSLVLTLPRGVGPLIAPVARPAGTARCDVPGAPSSLGVGPFEPAYDPGVSAIRTYYRFVDEHHWSAAYDLAVDQRASLARFVAGYRDTARVAIDLLAVPTYRVPYGGATYACVGIHLTAQQRGGAVRPYGGWIMAEVRSASQAYVVIGGSVLRPGGKPVIATRTTCSAHVPHSGRAHLR